MLIGLRNALTAGKRLPYDAEVEYLESTGTQYIDTGVSGHDLRSSGRLECEVTFVALRTYSPCAGISRDYNLNFWGLDNKTSRIYARFTGSLTTINASDFSLENFVGAKAHISAGNGKSTVTINGISKSRNYSYLCADNNDKLLLFGTARTDFIGYFKLWNFKVSIDGVLVRDFIPVRFTNEQSQTESAMYDRVSGELFRNQGTGAFVIGPDKSAANGGGYKRKCVRRSYRRFSRPSARFWQPRLWKEVA